MAQNNTERDHEGRGHRFLLSEKQAWYFYDWGMSAFSTVVAGVFLGPYLTGVVLNAADENGFVHPLGLSVRAGSFYPYVVSVSAFLQAVFLPFFGALADYSNRKREMLGLFAYLGAASTMALYFVIGSKYMLGGLLFLCANLSFGAAIVFYNAFLLDISGADERNQVSSKGWAIGYLGGGLLLALNMAFFMQARQFGLETDQAVRISLASAGLWWAGWALLPLYRLHNRGAIKSFPKEKSYFAVGFQQLRETVRKVRAYPQTLRFLLAYLLYNDGIQTVISLSSQFGAVELKISLATLSKVYLLVQFVAFLGALLFNLIAGKIGSYRAIIVSLLIWIAIIIFTYSYLKTTVQFFYIGAAIGIVLGGSQALSRSLFSLMIPKGRESEYFGVYEISERGTSWLGPLLFGLALQLTGRYRIAILSVVLFFISGIMLLLQVDVRKAIKAAGNDLPSNI